VPKRDPKFTSNFCNRLFKGFGTNLNSIIAYHPDSYGNMERINWIIEDMLRMYVMDKPSRSKDCLHLVKFYFNNGYQESLKMSPFESLYDKKCNIIVVGTTQQIDSLL
jgi:hypothetical protein